MASILLIDDNESLRAMMAHALTLAGHKVITAGDGKAAMRAFAQHAVDLVITDLVMPDQDGVETLMLLRKSHPKLPVIAISGDSPTHAALYLSVARKLGAVATLQKPFAVGALLAAAETALAQPGGGQQKSGDGAVRDGGAPS